MGHYFVDGQYIYQISVTALSKDPEERTKHLYVKCAYVSKHLVFRLYKVYRSSKPDCYC